MPYTLNGVGTRYLGKKNPALFAGRCASCNRDLQLEYYETREWFCVIFVPLIPLGKFRILRYCSGCRRHHRMPLEKFQAMVAAGVAAPLAAVRLNPADPEARVSLIRSYFQLELYPEARQASDEAMSRFPAHVLLNRLAGELAAGQGDLAGAAQRFRAAAEAAPQDSAARQAYGIHLTSLKQWQEAATQLEAARRLDPGNSATLWWLAESLLQQQHWLEALQSLEQYQAVKPEMAAAPDLLDKLRRCKEAMNYPVSPAEKKAGSRWRRFFSRAAPPGGRPRFSRRTVAVAALIAGLVAIAALLGSYIAQQRRTVYLDNGLPVKVTVEVANGNFALAPGQHESIELPPGRHTIRVSSAAGDIERGEFEIIAPQLYLALFDDSVYIYNVSEAHVYMRQSIAYSASGDAPNGKMQLFAHERWLQLSGVKHVFGDPPKDVTLQQGESVTYEDVLQVLPGNYNRLAVIRDHEGDSAGALKAARKSVALDGCNRIARKNLIELLLGQDQAEGAIAAARDWIQGCPADAVNAHRAYQQLQIDRGHGGLVLAEYRDALAAHPESAAAHYLYGRLLDDPALELPEFQAAIRLDPQLAQPHAGAAYDLSAMDQWPQAATEAELAIHGKGADSSHFLQYATIAIVNGTAARAASVLNAIAAAAPKDHDAFSAHFLLALDQAHWQEAEKLLGAYEGADGPLPETLVFHVQLLQAQGQAAPLAALLAKAAQDRRLKQSAGHFGFEQDINDGNYPQAVARMEAPAGKAPPEPDGIRLLYAAAAKLLNGQHSADEELLARAQAAVADDETPEKFQRFIRLQAQILRGKVKPAEAVAQTGKINPMFIKHAWFFLGAREFVSGNAAAARDDFRNSEKFACDYNFPRFAAHRLAAESKR